MRGGVEARGRRGASPPSAGARRPSPVIDRSRGTSASPPRRRRGARAGTGARWRIVRVAQAHARSSSVLHLAPEYQSSPSCSLQASAPSSLRHGSAQRADRALAACLRARSAHILLASLPLQAANYQHAPSPEEGGGEETGARAGRQHGTQVRLAPRECAHRREHARRRLSRTFSGRGKW